MPAGMSAVAVTGKRCSQQQKQQESQSSSDLVSTVCSPRILGVVERTARSQPDDWCIGRYPNAERTGEPTWAIATKSSHEAANCRSAVHILNSVYRQTPSEIEGIRVTVRFVKR